MFDYTNSDLQVNENHIELYKWKSFFESILEIILEDSMMRSNFSIKNLYLKFGTKSILVEELCCHPEKDHMLESEYQQIFYCNIGVSVVFNAIALKKCDLHHYIAPLELEIRPNGLKLIKIANSFISNNGPKSGKHIVRNKIIDLMKEYDVVDYYQYNGLINDR